MNRRAIAIATLAIVMLGFGAFACLIRFRIDRLVFPRIFGTSTANIVASIPPERTSTARMLIRGYGTNRIGCVVFFPGQHGGITTYERTLFPSLVSQGIKVFAASYPGQDGAPGASTMAEVNVLASSAVSLVSRECGQKHLVVLGRSLGSMVAAYSVSLSRPAGLVLVSAAPSLSAAIASDLRSHWYLWPFRALPIRLLLCHDYSLIEALRPNTAVPVLVFQGSRDQRTPLALLRSEYTAPRWCRIIVVRGGTHLDTYLVAKEAIVEAVKGLLGRHKPNNSFEPKPLRGPA